jgi:hypothetical protein
MSQVTPGGPTPQVPVADISAMQNQLAEFNVQVSALRAQLRGLNRQLNSKIMAERPAQPAPQQNAGVQQEKPMLALDAGPMEPIRVEEREAVKESIRR